MPMAAGTDCSHPFIRLDGSYNKSSVSHAKDEFQEESDEEKQPSDKPPRHFSVEQHSISSETLLLSADLFKLNNIFLDSCVPLLSFAQ
nr:probable protein phosphatase 2C 27 isoform X1 [Ipomoea batatas]GMD65233.1 probable protein phosphatase 2C 27 isoform X1 [Ipomoea batatas]